MALATNEQLERLKGFGFMLNIAISQSCADAFIQKCLEDEQKAARETPASTYQPDVDPTPATDRQRECLAYMGVEVKEPLTKARATDLIEDEVAKRREWPATAKQKSFLQAEGKWRPGMRRGDAWDAIQWIKRREGSRGRSY